MFGCCFERPATFQPQANDYTFVINNANGFRVLLLPGMNSEEDEVEMSPDELQQYVYAVVQQNRVVAQRAADVAAIEQWVLHQENEISKNNLLFKNAFESVLECEAKMKDLYSKLGLEYKDGDSEDEGAAKRPTGVIQITDDEEEEEDDAGGTENSSIDHDLTSNPAAETRDIEMAPAEPEDSSQVTEQPESVAEGGADPSAATAMSNTATPQSPASGNTTVSAEETASAEAPVSTVFTSVTKTAAAGAQPDVSNTSKTPSSTSPANKKLMQLKKMVERMKPIQIKAGTGSRVTPSTTTSAASAKTTPVTRRSCTSLSSTSVTSQSKAPDSVPPPTKPPTPTITTGAATSPTSTRVSTTAPSFPRPPTNPPEGPQTAPETTSILEVGMSVLGRKRTKTWHSGILKEIRRIDGVDRYKVEFGKRKCLLSGHHVAYEKAAQLKDLFIGARVVARYKEEHQNWLHSAILAELPDRKNRMRFLVFFDDGHSAYVGLPDMHLVHAPSNNVLEDIEDVAWQHFVQNYLKAYPCVIYVTKPEGEPVEVDYDGQWLPGCIKQVDCSLIKVVLKDDDRTVWLHKGSDRLKHIFQMKERAAEAKKQASLKTQQRFSTTCTRAPTTTAAAPQAATTTTSAAQRVATTSVSTHSKSMLPVVSLVPISLQSVTSSVVVSSKSVSQAVTVSASSQSTAASHQPPRIQQGIKRGPPSPDLPKYSNRLVYTPHRCCPACLDGHRPPTHQPRGRNPLLIPLLHGFRRMTGRCREKQKLVFHVFYRSPCGCSLASMEDVQEFLLQTRCDFLYIDMFCLDPDVLVKRGLGPERQTLFWQQDISKNSERVPVSCVNEVDSFPLPNLAYFTKRIPAFGVNINTHPDFLVGCDCTDGCRDRFKCACQQLTIVSTSLCPGGPVDSTVGYSYKRLLKNVPTGIYECNAMCRCDPKMCSNRVVQQDMQVRLQVFKMKQKGWGVRCKDDLARGTFICVLTGRILNESVIGMERNMGGNKHLTNLDYIEAVEHLKEGYESEARCTDDDDEGGGAEEEGELSEEETLVQEMREDNSDSEHQDCSSDSSFVAEESDTWSVGPRSYVTRRSGAVAQGERGRGGRMNVENQGSIFPGTKEDGNEKDDESPTTHGNRKGLDASDNKQKEGEGTQRRCIAVKSSYQRVKPLKAAPDPEGPTNVTRRLFDGQASCFVIDTRQQGNVARYFNHSCKPNMFVQNVFVDTHDLRFPWIAFFANNRITAGTELTWDYNYKADGEKGKAVACCCGAAECRGRLV
ncbi:histone-lysine N-methyltransferase SETDB1-like isoform X1 [Denticeps clupeoides]|uniref:histone-lysine N-methyltransferase SETDB1-like isoform X1 n=3 Tax=Denticeps clupeoides TaxID=299321 RepID=UPI0010A33AB8|nr:histone-lysine N-methyltransferase SETDB1-like isoform X1 [Denticeps clupeoides]